MVVVGRPSSSESLRYDVEIQRDLRIPTRDPAVSLSADLWLPKGANRVPALVTVHPYRKEARHGGLGVTLQWFAERGYACLFVNLQGIGSSDGIPRQPFDPAEGDDAVAAVDWAASQEWCAGDVGMWGLSYGGLTTMRAAARHPRGLKAIIPIMGTLIHDRSSDPGDMLRIAQWGGMMLAEQLMPPLINYTSDEEQRRWYRRLHEIDPALLGNASQPSAWLDRAVNMESITVPTLSVGGWRDLACDPMVRVYEQIQGPRKLLVGPWGHVMPQNSAVEPINFLAIALRWWDHWLRNVDNGVMDEPAVTVYMQGRDSGWLSFESWPPEKSDLILAGGENNELISPVGAHPLTNRVIAVYEPDATIGALGGDGILCFPLDQHDDDLRALSFTGEPLVDDLLICGRPEVTVRLAPGKSAHGPSVRRIVARLTAVDPSGRSQLVTGGVVFADQPSLEHRMSLRTTVYRIPAGSRLRLALSDADFPRLMPLPHPCPIAVAGIELVIPALPEGVGTSVEMQSIEKPQVSIDAPWSITRDVAEDSVAVRSTWALPLFHTSEGHVLETDAEFCSSVGGTAADGAVMMGKHKAVARMNSGEEISIIATVRFTQTGVWARGEVCVDGATTFDRTWEVPLGLGG